MDKAEPARLEEPDFVYRAGSTILIDPSTQEVRRVMCTAGTITDDTQLERVRTFLTGGATAEDNAFDAGLRTNRRTSLAPGEPFAILHREADA